MDLISKTKTGNRTRQVANANRKIEKAVVSGYQTIEDNAVSGCKAIEDGVVDGYRKVEKKFVEVYLTIEGNRFVLKEVGKNKCKTNKKYEKA